MKKRPWFFFYGFKIKWLAGVISLFFLIHAAKAESIENTTKRSSAPQSTWYIQTDLGTQFAFKADTEIPSIFSKPPLRSQPIYRAGPQLGLHIGYLFNKPFRLETELSYRHLPMSQIQNAIGEGSVTALKQSYTDVYSIFLNGLYDFHLSDAPIFPYMGLGAGYVYVKNQIRPDPSIPVGGGIFFTQKKLFQHTWGYQGIIGIAYSLSPSFRLGLDYRYLETRAQWTRGETNLGKDGYLTKQKLTDSMLACNLTYFLN